jgi:hypothetical protein
MQNTAVNGAGGATKTTGTGNATGNTGATGNAGNEQLEAAFNSAIAQAQKTLEISTEKGAQLYALKQRPS